MVEATGWVKVGRNRPRKQANGAKKTDRSWGVFVLSVGGKVLLLKHNKNPAFWSFSKGHKENDEEPNVETAIRELKEEAGLKVRRLWMEGETWQEYCDASGSVTEGGDSLEGPKLPRTFVERYKYKQYGRWIEKEITFFVAKTQASEEDVNFEESNGEITGYMWVSLDPTRDKVAQLTRDEVAKETRMDGKEPLGMYDEDLDLFETIQQEILEPRVSAV